MENCYYHGNTICTFDLKDENGFYYEDRVLSWKQAAAERLLTCVECGAPVYLAAGPLKEPYFAHYDLIDCDYSSGHETEELKKGKRFLYQLVKRSFSKADIRARFRMENGMYSTFFCQFSDKKAIAIDYRLQNNSLKKYTMRDTFYKAGGITPIYILSIRQEKNTGQIDWYQSLLQSTMGYLIFIDVTQESMTLKKSFSYRLGNERRFLSCKKSYPVKELLIDQDGYFLCDFSEECAKLEHQIKEEKNRYQVKQERLKKLREEQIRHQEIEAQNMKLYRRTQELKANEEAKGLLPATVDLNEALLEKCKRMIEEGNGYLVSKKYYDAIMNH